MVHRHMKPLAAALLLVLSLAFLAGASPANARPSLRAQAVSYDNLPAGLRPSPSTAMPGQEVNITVYLSQTTTVDQPVAVGASDPTAFTSFPSYVTVPAGANHAMFSVYVQSNAPQENITLTAACNGTQAMGYLALGAQ